MLTKTPRCAVLPASPWDVDSQRKYRHHRALALTLLTLNLAGRAGIRPGIRGRVPYPELMRLSEEQCEAQTNKLLAELRIEVPLSDEEWDEIARAVHRLDESVANSQGSPAPVSADRRTFVEFDYSKEEWSEIEKAARSARKRPPPKRLRKELVDCACDYVAMRTSTRSQRRQAWQRAARQVDRLQQTILVAQGGMLDDWLSTLSDIRCEAEIKAVVLSEEPRDYFNKNSKMEYEFTVLSIWGSLGGKLKISRNSGTGKIDGPLARFFRAVTVPVMGTLAPSLESLPDIVQRQKRFIASRKKTRPILQLLQLVRLRCIRSEVLGRKSSGDPFWAFPPT